MFRLKKDNAPGAPEESQAPVKKNGWSVTSSDVLFCHRNTRPPVPKKAERRLIMMTLKEVRELVDIEDISGRVPTKEQLGRMETKIVAREVISDDTEIMVFKNGYVLYRGGRNVTVFPLPAKKGYSYDSVTGSSVLDAEFLENEKWYIRLLMEGEDRIADNQRRQESNHSVYSYSLKGEAESRDLEDPAPDVLEELILEETLREIRDLLTERQQEALYHYFYENRSQRDIASQMCTSQTGVYKLLKRSMRKLRNTLGDDIADSFIF